MKEKQFANGIIFAYPNDKAPEFVIGKISIKKSEFMPFLESQQGDWVNLDVKLSKADKIYCELNNWKPNSSQSSQKNTEFDNSNGSELPF